MNLQHHYEWKVYSHFSYYTCSTGRSMGTAHTVFTDQNSELHLLSVFEAFEVFMVVWLRSQFFWDMMLCHWGNLFPVFQRNTLASGLWI
jgi:hypothetical protein